MSENNKNVLELEEFKATSFMGIDSSSPIIIDFTAKRKNQNFIEFSGDQGQRKTSTLMGILYVMGATFNLKKDKLLNSTDNAINADLKFTYNEEQYHVIAKTSRIELKKLSEESGKWKPVDSPVAVLKQIFGPVGLSPFAVKELDPKQQIRYFLDMFGLGEDGSKSIKKLEEEIEVVFMDRRDVNREAKALSNALEIEPLYQQYEKSQERFKNPINASKEKARYEEVAEKKKGYDQYENTMAVAEGELKDKLNEVKELDAKLAAKKKEVEKLEGSVEKGKKWLEDNKGITAEFEKVQKEWLDLSTTLADQDKWKDILKKEKELFDKQERSVTLTGEIDTKREKLLKLTKKCLPNVEGLEIKVAAGIDKEGKQEGVFMNDQAIHELSESEYTDMWCKIWDAAGVNFVFVENTSSLGSGAVETMNQIAKNGGIIFGTRMERKQKEISY